MTFDTIYKANEWFLNYKPLIKDVDYFCSSDKAFKNWKFGDYILLQHIISINKQPHISRPMYGIFTSFTVWDQAIVLQFIQNKRAWMYSHKILGSKPDIQTYISSFDDDITAIEFWTGNINLLGHWKKKPSISELKLSLSKQIIDRDTIISDIIK